jgi:hypothetical protein
MARNELSEAELETRLEAALAVVAVMGLQVLIGIVSSEQGWSLWGLPWWVWLALVAPELVLLVLLTWSRPRQRLVETGRRRAVSLGLVAYVGLGNAVALVALLGSILSGNEVSGGQLLFKSLVIWTTNVIALGLWFWELDRGGPSAEPSRIHRRRSSSSPRWTTPAVREGAGTRASSTTSTSRSPTRWPSAPRRHAAHPPDQARDAQRGQRLVDHRSACRRARYQHLGVGERSGTVSARCPPAREPARRRRHSTPRSPMPPTGSSSALGPSPDTIGCPEGIRAWMASRSRTTATSRPRRA